MGIVPISEIRDTTSGPTVTAEYEKSLCARLNCCACCKDMQLIVTVEHLIDYVDSCRSRGLAVTLIPVTSRDVVQAAQLRPGVNAIFYQTEVSRRNSQPKELYVLSKGKKFK